MLGRHFVAICVTYKLRNETGPHGGALWRFVSEYQTLITGTMAVGAARLTIRQMQATDRLQIAHHQQQMNIATLPSHLAILMGVLAKALRNCSDKALEFVCLCDGEFGEPAWDRKANFSLGMCIVGYRHLGDSFTHSWFTACSSLFSPDVDHEVMQVIQWLDLLNGMLPEDKTFILRYSTRPDGLSGIRTWNPILSDLAATTQNLNASLAHWSKAMLGNEAPIIG